MNPPPPAASRSSALVALGGAHALTRPSVVPSDAPYASAPWSPATRGWLVPSAAQEANATTAADRTKALALATNRAANAVQLHKSSAATFVAAPRRDPTVLDEDTYLSDMNSIIRRDFYPALDAMERKLALHTPSWNGQMTGANTDARRGEQKRRKGVGAAVATPGATPHTAAALLAPQQRAEGGSFEDETPVPHANRPDSPSRLDQPGAAAAAASSSSSSAAAAAASSTAVVPHVSAAAAAAAAAEEAAATRLHPTDLRLGSYLELHTSADNASFTEIQRKRAKHLDARMHWANRDFEQKANDQRIVLADDPSRSGNVSGWKYEVKNRLFYYPDHKGMSERHTDAYDSSLTPAQQVADALAQRSASIEYENTRFPGPLTNPFPGQHASSNPQAAPAGSSSAAATPSVGGYKLLRTPVLAPGAAGAESPLVTWGQLLATPSHLREEDAEGVGPLQLGPEVSASAAASSSGSSGGFGFKIAATPRRDELAWGLSDAARKKESQAKKRKQADATPVPLSLGLFAAATPVHTANAAGLMMRPPLTPAAASAAAARARRGGATPAPAAASTPMLSPAAQRLLKATVSSAAGRRGSSRSSSSSSALGGLDAQLRASYSPSPAALAHGTR